MKKSKFLDRMLKDKQFMQRQTVYMRDDFLDYLSSMDFTKLDKLILNDKKFLGQQDDLRDNYIDYIENSLGDLKPTPKSRTNYVGIEIECFTSLDHLEVMEKLVDLGLENTVHPGSDGSIDADFGDDCELRILLPEKKLHEGLTKLSKLFTKNKFGVNESCGLHVHLDMRNRDLEQCYDRLMRFQDMLFGMVKPSRWNNEFCQYVPKAKRDLLRNQRYVAINRNSYAKHKTIEIRLHQSTLDTKVIEKWVRLLLQMIKAVPPPVLETKADILKWVKGQQVIEAYVKKTFNEKWLERKKVVANGGGEYGADEDGYY